MNNRTNPRVRAVLLLGTLLWFSSAFAQSTQTKGVYFSAPPSGGADLVRTQAERFLVPANAKLEIREPLRIYKAGSPESLAAGQLDAIETSEYFYVFFTGKVLGGARLKVEEPGISRVVSVGAGSAPSGGVPLQKRLESLVDSALKRLAARSVDDDLRRADSHRPTEDHMKTLASATRALLPICAGIAVISSIASISLWHALRAERLLTADLHTQLTDAKTASHFSIPPSPQRIIVNGATPATVLVTEAPAGKTDVSASGLQQNLWKDPEYRKLSLAQTRKSMAGYYEGLAEDLGMSKGEVDRLFDLLADNETAFDVENTNLRAAHDSQNEAAVQEVLRRREALMDEQNASVRALLGDTRYAQFQDYQENRPARAGVALMANQLSQAGMPLTEAQRRSLTTAMSAEMKRQSTDEQTMAEIANSGNPNDWEEKARRKINAVAPYLNSGQLTELREQTERQLAMTRIATRLQKERERAGANSNQGAKE